MRFAVVFSLLTVALAAPVPNPQLSDLLSDLSDTFLGAISGIPGLEGFSNLAEGLVDGAKSLTGSDVDSDDIPVAAYAPVYGPGPLAVGPGIASSTTITV